MKLRLFRALVYFSLLFTILTNLVYLTGYLIHFGGAMSYASVTAEKILYKDLYQEDPQGHDVYLRHGGLVKTILLIDWHGDWQSRSQNMIPSLKPGDRFYFLTLHPEGPALEHWRQEGLRPQELASVSAFNAPPFVFGLMKRILPRKIQDRFRMSLYKISV